MIPIAISPSPSVGGTVFTAAAIPINPMLFAGQILQLPGGLSYTWDGLLTFTFAAPVPAGDYLNLFGDGTFPAAGASSTVAAPASHSTTELLASIRQRSFTAGSARDFDDPSVLRVLNENANTYLLKLIAKRNTNYLVETVDLAVASGVPAYPIPSVAIAGALRAITLIIGNVPYGLVEMGLAQAVASNLVPLSTQFPTGYYFMGPNIVLWPTQSLSGILRIHYHRRPSTIVLENQCIQITGFPGGAAAGNYRASFASLPAGFAGGTLVDVVSNIPNFYRWQTSKAIAAITSTTVDIPGPQPTNLGVGDWICIAGTAPVVTDSPAEVLDALLEATFADMMKAKGANETYQRALDGLRRKEEDCGPLIQQRNTGAQRKISAFPDVSGWPWSGG